MLLCPHSNKLSIFQIMFFNWLKKISQASYYPMTLYGFHNKQNYVFQNYEYILLFYVCFCNSDRCGILNFLLYSQVLYQFSQI